MQEFNEQNLELKFDPRTIKHLGVQMYQTLPPVLAELISNSYDANASWVRIIFKDDNGQKQIIVNDNGDGMSFKDINENFLVIGKNRRENETEVKNNQRKVTGRKGLGKLAVFGIANQMQVQTVKDGVKNIFNMDLNHILSSNQDTYQPDIMCKDESVEISSETQIILNEIKRKTPFNLAEIRESIAKRFAFTDEFSIYLEEEGKEPLLINSETKWEYVVPQFIWEFPGADAEVNFNNITGKILTTEKPLKEDQRGIFLFARGKLVNPNAFYGLKTTTSLAYNYMTGVFYVDYIDDFEEDYVSTNRDGLTWEQEELQELQDWLKEKIQFVEKRWRALRVKAKENTVKEITGVDLAAWTKTMPQKYQASIKDVVAKIIDKEEIDKEITSDIVQKIYSIVPPYPFFHWRELHREIQNASEVHYKNRDYYNAFLEASKRYKNAVKSKSKVVDDNDLKIISSSFGKEHNKLLKVTSKCQRRPNGENFSESTLNNIEEGQKFLSMGVVTGGRNVLSHEEHNDLREAGLFS